MSHSTLGVILPWGTSVSEVEATLARVLAPFDEAREVEPYQRKCHCIGRLALYAACGAADAVHGPNPRSTVTEADWQIWHDRWTATRNAVEAEIPFKNDPDPSCKSCNGTGSYESTYNPQSKWDWYAIGGRWAGDLVGHELTQKEYDLKMFRGIYSNMASVNSLLIREPMYQFFALLTPEGEWLERGRMGWWGVVSDEKPDEDWERITRETYEKYRDYRIVLVDVHI